MNIVVGTPAELRPGLMVRLGRFRHRVFVEQLGWPLQCENGLEFDQFDRPDTVHVVICDAVGEVVGSARLLPTTQPYLLRDVFPEVLQGCTPPQSADVWELSRFAAMDLASLGQAPDADGGLHAMSSGAMRQFSSPVAVQLLTSALEAAAARGASRVITLSPMGVERLLRRAGFPASRAAPVVRVGDMRLFACWIPTALSVAQAA